MVETFSYSLLLIFKSKILQMFSFDALAPKPSANIQILFAFANTNCKNNLNSFLRSCILSQIDLQRLVYFVHLQN